MTRGEAALPRAMTGRLVLEFRERGTRRRVVLGSEDAEVELTAREFEVLQRLRRTRGNRGDREPPGHLTGNRAAARRIGAAKAWGAEPPTRDRDRRAGRARRASSDREVE